MHLCCPRDNYHNNPWPQNSKQYQISSNSIKLRINQRKSQIPINQSPQHNISIKSKPNICDQIIKNEEEEEDEEERCTYHLAPLKPLLKNASSIDMTQKSYSNLCEELDQIESRLISREEKGRERGRYRLQSSPRPLRCVPAALRRGVTSAFPSEWS